MQIYFKHLKYGAKSQWPRRIVVHAMAEYIKENGKVYHAVDYLKKLGLSAHCLGAPNGDLYRCRHEEEGAYHARGYNEDSLGYEFLVPGVHDYGSFLEAIKHEYVSPEQYATGLQVIRDWMQRYHITKIDPHSGISPGRKLDPGAGFPWDGLREDLFL